MMVLSEPPMHTNVNTLLIFTSHDFSLLNQYVDSNSFLMATKELKNLCFISVAAMVDICARCVCLQCGINRLS